MWVFDGEKWVQEGSNPRSEQTLGPMDAEQRDRFYPELQVIEIPRIEKREKQYIPVVIP